MNAIIKQNKKVILKLVIGNSRDLVPATVLTLYKYLDTVKGDGKVISSSVWWVTCIDIFLDILWIYSWPPNMQAEFNLFLQSKISLKSELLKSHLLIRFNQLYFSFFSKNTKLYFFLYSFASTKFIFLVISSILSISKAIFSSNEALGLSVGWHFTFLKQNSVNFQARTSIFCMQIDKDNTHSMMMMIIIMMMMIMIIEDDYISNSRFCMEVGLDNTYNMLIMKMTIMILMMKIMIMMIKIIIAVPQVNFQARTSRFCMEVDPPNFAWKEV